MEEIISGPMSYAKRLLTAEIGTPLVLLRSRALRKDRMQGKVRFSPYAFSTLMPFHRVVFEKAKPHFQAI